MTRLTCTLALGLGLTVAAACETATGPAAAPASNDAAPFTLQANAGAGGAWIIRDDQDCFLPGIDADALPYPLSAPCKLQLVLTGNGRGVASGTVKAQVPNDYGRAVRLRFGPISPFPCFFIFDTDRDGTPDRFMETTPYTMVVAASGQLHMSCQFPGE